MLPVTQVTTLCAISAEGGIIPPMHIFAGKCFKVDPMSGCIYLMHTLENLTKGGSIFHYFYK